MIPALIYVRRMLVRMIIIIDIGVVLMLLPDRMSGKRVVTRGRVRVIEIVPWQIVKLTRHSNQRKSCLLLLLF